MDVRHNSPDDEDPDIAGILKLDEESDGDAEFQEAHIIQWVAETVVAGSTGGEDNDPFMLDDVICHMITNAY